MTIKKKSLQDFRQTMERYERATKKSAHSVMRDSVAGICRQIMMESSPRGRTAGKGTDAKKQGIAAIRRDTRPVIAGYSDTYEVVERRAGQNLARAFWAAKVRGDIDAQKKILSSAGVPIDIIKTLPESTRRGMVMPRRTRSQKFTPKYTMTEKHFDSLIRRAAKNVGLAASGWAHAAIALGRKTGVPAWLLKHNKKTNIEVSGDRGDIRIYATNLWHHVKFASRKGDVMAAEKKGLANFLTRMKREISAIERKYSRTT